MFSWFSKKKEPKNDGGMKALQASVKKKQEVAERILNGFWETHDTREEDVPITFPDRRHARSS